MEAARARDLAAKLLPGAETDRTNNRCGKLGRESAGGLGSLPPKVRESARYVKIVEWSEEDQCYVGSSPGLIYGGCHGDSEREVFDELCKIVEEAIALYKTEGKPLPPPTSGRDFANKMQHVA